MINIDAGKDFMERSFSKYLKQMPIRRFDFANMNTFSFISSNGMYIKGSLVLFFSETWITCLILSSLVLGMRIGEDGT